MVSRRDGNRNLWSDLRCSASPLMEFKDVGIYPQKRAATGLRYVYDPLAHHAPPTRVRTRACSVLTELSGNDFFIARLRVRYGERCIAARSRRTGGSKDVVWKIGSSNHVISFDSRRDVLRRLPIPPDILTRIFPRAIKEYRARRIANERGSPATVSLCK